MRAYEIVAGSSSLEGVRACERPDPKPQRTQILVRMRAASLNFRDLLVPRGHYMGGTVGVNTIPLSDGAGEVIAVGSEVTRFTVGAASLATSTPARVDPVNDTMSMSGWLARATPTPGPSPLTRLYTPAGTPAASRISVKM